MPRRVGLVRDPGGHGTDPAVDVALDHSAATLTTAGYELVEVELPMLQEALNVYAGLVLTEFAGGWPRISSLIGPEASRYIQFDLDEHPPLELPEYLRCAALHLTVRRAWTELASHTPLLLGPVSTRSAFAPGEESSTVARKRRYGRSMTMSVWSTVVGAPSVAVPTGLSDGGPIGVQLVGPPFREEVCLDAAQVVQDAAGVLTPIEPRNDRGNPGPRPSSSREVTGPSRPKRQRTWRST